MNRCRGAWVEGLVGVLLVLPGGLAASPAVAFTDEPVEIANWTAPPYWSARVTGTSEEQPEGQGADAQARSAQARRALASGPTALPFVSVFPCRLVDTRGNGAPLTGGFLPPATVRSYTLAGLCNIPASAQAISLNATVVKPTGPGFLTIWPEGGTFPPVSTLNYLGNDVIVNAAVAPLSATGGVSVALGVSGGDVILDTNGYYASSSLVSSLSGLTGDVTLAAGPNVTIASAGGTLTISAPLTGLNAGNVTAGILGLGFGGTGSTNPAGARANLGAASGGANGDITSLSALTTPLSPAQGGTGSATPFQSGFQARVTGTCGLGQSIATVNPDGTVGCGSTNDARPGFARTAVDFFAGQYPSIAIGTDGLALISYRSLISPGTLEVGHCGDAACASFAGTVIDIGPDVGYFTSIAIGSDGLGLISYRDNANAALKIAHCSNVPCTTATITTPRVGFGKSLAVVNATYTSIAIGSDGLGLISVYDPVALSLRTVHCNNAACSSATAATIDSNGDVGLYNTITIGADGLGLIAYYVNDGFVGIRTAHCADVACTTATISNNYVNGPRFLSITIGADGLGLIIGSNPVQGILGVAHCNDVACTTITGNSTYLDFNGGSFTSITTGPDGLGLIAYRDNVRGGLRVAHCSNVACSTASITAVDALGGYDVSITIGSDGLGLISHYDLAAQTLRLVHCANALCTPFVRRR